MTATEIDLVTRRLRARVEAILSGDELAAYDAYRGRVRAAMAQQDARPVEPTPVEQAVLGKIAADTQAAALDKQLLALIRVERLPQ
jgi:riboflavin biosynthesis pyrimidine reductase